MAEWSKLSFTSVELLAHAVGYRFKSCLRLLFFYLYSVSTNKKFSHPSYLSSWMRSCHTMVKSAVLPKTTILCTSITVISLWLSLSENVQLYSGQVYSTPWPPPCSVQSSVVSNRQVILWNLASGTKVDVLECNPQSWARDNPLLRQCDHLFMTFDYSILYSVYISCGYDNQVRKNCTVFQYLVGHNDRVE